MIVNQVIINKDVKEIKKYECRGYLFCLYILCKMSTIEIGKELEITHVTIRYWLIKFQIPLRSYKKAQKNYWSKQINDKNIKYKNKKWLQYKYIELELFMVKIAKECKVSISTINYWLKKFKIKKPSIMGKYKNKKWLKNKYIKLEMSMTKIAKECMVSHNTIRHWLIKLNIPIRITLNV
ncbi:hypothetical protein LCGC14_1360000 [marine sediment metagenome]|uniref:Uncharacterized protein n=1 Tax=marine sediment metagenome TaxID=412755 RepID=A0A0F9NAN4_9ZZZZ